jgi:arsenate reductase (thioredoxin)
VNQFFDGGFTGSHFGHQRHLSGRPPILRPANEIQPLPSLTTRLVEDRLSEQAVVSGRDLRGTPEVLFVYVCKCRTVPDGRGLLWQVAGDEVHVRTVGLRRPSGQIDPTLVEVLDEIGVPVLAEFPKPLTDEAGAGR